MKEIVRWEQYPTMSALSVVANTAPTWRLSPQAAYEVSPQQASANMMIQMPVVMIPWRPLKESATMKAQRAMVSSM